MTPIRRRLQMALAGALCVAAATGIVAILSGSFDRTEGEILLTSLGFAVFSATSAPGASLRLRDSSRLRLLGGATIAASLASFVLFEVGVWTQGDDTLWRTFACFALVAFACSHASLVTAARRVTDGAAVGALCTISIVLGAVDALLGIIAASSALEPVDEGFVELVAVLVILLVLTTVLQPIARRIASAPPERAEEPAAARVPQPFAAEVLAAADRIDALNADPGNLEPEIRREVERLRQLARAYSA
jgi:hypothetical protein